jgi:polyisoprenoid-binding protein YceI
MTRLWIAGTLAVVLVASPPMTPRASGAAYQIDRAKSSVKIAVGKAGAFSFAGHSHEVTGPIEGTLDVDPDNPSVSQVTISVPTPSLKVSGANEPPADRPKVQEAMESDKVLDVARFPRITFKSTGVNVTQNAGATLDVVVSGQLTIRDVTRPESVPVHVELAGQSLTANGRFAVKQTEFGIKPISVSGVVSVKDKLDISFSVAARR